MGRLIRVFAWCTYQAVPFSVSHLTYCLYYYHTSVCGEPVVPVGYKLYSIASRTYGSIVPVICATRYTGKPKAIRCNADGVWSTPTGCSVPGMMYIQALTLY